MTGVGQSLYSGHLDAVYGANHSFIDPNIWYNEEEMRKQVSQCAGCFILTAQEKPETGRKMREDLFKKACSADGIAGRPPYGMRTRMIELVCWLRYEVNSMFTLSGVTEGNFASAFRRAFVWKPNARFIDPEIIAGAYPDANMDGYFCKNEELKDFLRSGPCILAALRLQHAFELQHSREKCRQMIEDYAARPLTEDMMRHACGLPARCRSGEKDSQAENLQLPLDSTSQQERDELKRQLANVRDTIVQECLAKEKSIYTKGMMKYLVLPADHPKTMSKTSMYDELVQQGFLLLAHGVSAKYKDGTVPRLDLKYKLEELVPLRATEAVVTHREVHDLQAARNYMQGNSDREANVACMLQYLQEKHKALKRKGTAGKHTAETLERIADLEKFIRKIETREETHNSLLRPSACRKAFTENRTPVKKRRLTTKGSSCQATPDPTSQPDVLIDNKEIEMTYERDFQGLIRTRAYTRGPKIGAQRMSRVLQSMVCSGTHDLDIENSVFVILYQLLLKLNDNNVIPSVVMETMELCTKSRTDVCRDKLKMSVEQGKKVLHCVLFGGKIPVALCDNAFTRKLQQTSIYLRWTASSLITDVYNALGSMPEKTNPQASALHYLYACVEDYILETWASSCAELHAPGHLSLHFDGIRVGRFSSEVDVSSLCREAMSVIKEKTKFEVNIVEKHHYLFRALCRTPAESVEAPMQQQDLHRPGNCIPLAVARLFADRLEDIQKLLGEDNHKNKEAAQRSSRCYASVLEPLRVGVRAEPGLKIAGMGSYLLHTDHDGNPHCVACRVGENNLVTMWDGVYKTTMLLPELLAFGEKAMDAGSLVTFEVLGTMEDAEDEPAVAMSDNSLLGLHAGAGDLNEDWSECLQNHCECEGPQPGSDDECGLVTQDEDVEPMVTAGNRLLEELRNEVRAAAESSERNKRRCVLCPFRQFGRSGRVQHHICTYHVDRKQFTCSGTKQLKICCALFDHDQLQGSIKGSYLQRSADILRATVQPALTTATNEIDRDIRLVLTGNGPEYWRLTTIQESNAVRRVRNLYYSRQFGELVYRELLMCHGKCKAVPRRQT